MRILFTGASSFTGYWFVRVGRRRTRGRRRLSQRRRPLEGLRAERTRMVRKLCEARFGLWPRRWQ